MIHHNWWWYNIIFFFSTYLARSAVFALLHGIRKRKSSCQNLLFVKKSVFGTLFSSLSIWAADCTFLCQNFSLLMKLTRCLYSSSLLSLNKKNEKFSSWLLFPLGSICTYFTGYIWFKINPDEYWVMLVQLQIFALEEQAASMIVTRIF